MSDRFNHINPAFRVVLNAILSINTPFLLFGLLVCLIMITEYPAIGLILSLLLLALLLYTYISMLNVINMKIELDEDGIACKSMLKKCRLCWAEIKEVGITQLDGMFSKKSYFYFTTHSERHYSITHGEKLDDTNSIVRHSAYDKQIISVQYDINVYYAIKKYWAKDIKNIDEFIRQNKEVLKLPDDFA